MTRLFDMPAAELARITNWAFDPTGDVGELGGRIEVWEEPDPECIYVAGADFALGIQGRDYDAAVFLNATVRPVRQVAELHGHWGPDFERLLFAAGMYYGQAFVLGERQFGLDRLRALLKLGYGYMYYDRDEDSRGRKIKDKLGYWRGTNDICVPNLRRAIRRNELVLRSEALINQMGKVEYAPRTSSRPSEEAQDKDLGIKLSGGGSPDLVMACAYAWHAVGEREHYDPPAPRYKPGTAGDILGHDILNHPERGDRQGWRERRRQVRRKA